MNFPIYIAKRYLFSKGSTQAINIITGIAATGIVVGAMSLFIVLSAFDGLKELHLQYTSIADPDLTVFPSSGKFFSLSEAQKKELSNTTGIISYAEIVENQVLLNYKQKRLSAILKGINPDYSKVIATDSLIEYGSWFPEKEYFVVIGNQISNQLSLGINNFENPLDLYMPKPGKGQITNPINAFKREGVVVSGIYQLTNDLDQKYVFSHINLARRLLNLPADKVSNIELKLATNVNYEQVSEKIQKIFGNKVYTKNRIQLNESMYKMLNTENLIVYLLFTLVLIVALFSLIGAMIMMIIDKKKNLQTLYKIGASLKEIRLIFFFQGILMTILGGLLGVFIGFVLIKLQQTTSAIMITSIMAYPTKLSFYNALIVLITLYILGILASSIAAFSIKRNLIAD